MPHWAYLLGTCQVTELRCLLDILKIYSCHKTVNSQYVHLYLGLLLGLNCVGSSYGSSALATRATDVM